MGHYTLIGFVGVMLVYGGAYLLGDTGSMVALVPLAVGAALSGNVAARADAKTK